jgi:flagellar biosynthesis protein FlhB
MADSSKTEKATPRRRQKARERGQIARSRELISSLAVGTAVVTVFSLSPTLLGQWRSVFRQWLEVACRGDFDARPELVASIGSQLLGTGALIIGLSWMAAMAGALAQGGLVFAPTLLQPNLSRMSPAARVAQLFSLPTFGRLLKSMLPGTVIAVLAGTALCRDWEQVVRLPRFGIVRLAAFLSSHLFEIAWKSALVLLVWSGADYLIERQKLEGDLRMSRQDLMDEYKETEGHPAVKARIRRLRRQVQRKRMLEETKKATAVITNPTEFAIALKYSPEMPAPVVVAKGRNLLAQQIKQVARWQGIPLVENPPLAHALYRAVEIGQAIPPKLYAVVAAVLAAIYRAQQRVDAWQSGAMR